MKILLVEDDKELSKALNKVLELTGYSIDSAFDGLEALEYVDYTSYDLIIMDVMMPKMDGITTVKKIRDKKIATPILILTAKSMIDDKVEGLDSGADDYLIKPFQTKELLARIRALTRRSQVIPNLEIGNIILDPNNYELKANKAVKLTNKEYKLMELLIHNKNGYLSSEKIIDSVWDMDEDTDINVIWVFISTLRKKLEFVEADYTIKSLRGVGYHLEERKK